MAVFTTGGPRICVWIWADVTVMSTTYNYDFDLCPKRILRAEGELSTSKG